MCNTMVGDTWIEPISIRASLSVVLCGFTCSQFTQHNASTCIYSELALSLMSSCRYWVHTHCTFIVDQTHYRQFHLQTLRFSVYSVSFVAFSKVPILDSVFKLKPFHACFHCSSVNEMCICKEKFAFSVKNLSVQMLPELNTWQWQDNPGYSYHLIRTPNQ